MGSGIRQTLRPPTLEMWSARPSSHLDVQPAPAEQGEANLTGDGAECHSCHINDTDAQLKAFGDDPRLDLIRPTPFASSQRLNNLAKPHKSIATFHRATFICSRGCVTRKEDRKSTGPACRHYRNRRLPSKYKKRKARVARNSRANLQCFHKLMKRVNNDQPIATKLKSAFGKIDRQYANLGNGYISYVGFYEDIIAHSMPSRGTSTASIHSLFHIRHTAWIAARFVTVLRLREFNPHHPNFCSIFQLKKS